MREGRLDDTGGLAYRKRISHAGYTRNIISNNPPVYDEDGDLFSPNGSDNERHGSPIEENAFGDVQLEHLLRPLTAASELPEHPSLSVAYKTRALTQMADEALEMVRREKESLWKAKRLLQRFRGDADWVPCETFETEQDEMTLLGGGERDGEEGLGSAVPSVTLEGSFMEVDVTSELRNGGAHAGVGEEGVDVIDGVEATDTVPQPTDAIRETTEERRVTRQDGPGAEGDQTETNGVGLNVDNHPEDNQPPTSDKSEPKTAQNPALADLIEQSRDPEAASEHTSNSGASKETNGTNLPPSHSMTTRARARSPILSPSPSPSLSSTSIPTIHPWYLTPTTSLPDRDLGLPAPEAEETRKLLLLYVQKQEQIVRSLETLYTGLQRSDRLRKEVLFACKADGHVRDDGKGGVVTEMSDGEDWYDPSDWGLGRDIVLEKGKDEVEDAEEEGRRGGRRRRVNRM